MWTKYDYLCTNCDTLIQITTTHTDLETPDCVCAEPEVISIGSSNADVS